MGSKDAFVPKYLWFLSRWLLVSGSSGRPKQSDHLLAEDVEIKDMVPESSRVLHLVIDCDLYHCGDIYDW
jgi:hypothetical protein